MSTVQVSQWDMIIFKGATFHVPLIFRDGAGTLFDWLSLEIIITPRGTASPFSLTEANGKLTHTSTGTYLVALDSTETAGYAWSLGDYVMKAVETNGNVNPIFTSGNVIVK